MNPINNYPANQQAQQWSAHLGELAAEMSANKPELPVSNAAILNPLPSRLSAILNHLRQRNQMQEHAHSKLRINEFMAPSM